MEDAGQIEIVNREIVKYLYPSSVIAIRRRHPPSCQLREPS
jgi:hypothetical protein